MSDRRNSQASDITKRKKVQQKPLNAELAVDIIEAIPDGVVMVGIDSKVTFINKAFEKILGYNRAVIRDITECKKAEVISYRAPRRQEVPAGQCTSFSWECTNHSRDGTMMEKGHAS